MILTKHQEEGLKIAVQRYKNKEPWTCIGGFAGTGKSTLIKFIIEALNLSSDEVCYITFTGKAATVLAQKGCPNATTAHKLLYKAILNTQTGKYHFVPIPNIPKYKIIIVDEISMLPKTIWDRLLSHHIHVIALGDPAQLPPIDDNENNHVLDHPHIFLDEIMRQAAESEIIQLATHIRSGKSLNDFSCKNQEVMIVNKEDLNYGMYDWANQIICSKNKTRQQINDAVRLKLGYDQEPKVNDKIICLKNNWDICSISGDYFLTNGIIGSISSMRKEHIYLPQYIDRKEVIYLYTTFKFEDEIFYEVPIDYQRLITGRPRLTPFQEGKLLTNRKFNKPIPIGFDYGYAITCHKAQGSEWNKILVIEENFPFSEEEHCKWLYTAVTRAVEKIIVVKK